MAFRRELRRLNKSELIECARRYGLGDIGRETEREEIIDLIINSDDEHTDDLNSWREDIEAHIDKNRRRLLSQLPNCNGKCTEFGCPNLIVTRCWEAFSKDMI